MRIIGGSLKGRYIPQNKSLPVRPTTDYAKEALFQILENRIEFDQTIALDLFSGTGSLSLELASRGCPKVVSIDKHHACVAHLKKNAFDFGLNQISPIRADVLKFIAQPKTDLQFQLIIADPPYSAEFVSSLPEKIFDTNLLTSNGILVFEHEKRHDFSHLPTFEMVRNYGHVFFSFFQKT